MHGVSLLTMIIPYQNKCYLTYIKHNKTVFDVKFDLLILFEKQNALR